jgi:hypothetical protein
VFAARYELGPYIYIYTLRTLIPLFKVFSFLYDICGMTFNMQNVTKQSLI